MAEFEKISPRQQEVQFLYSWFIEDQRTFSNWTSKHLSEDEEDLVTQLFETPDCVWNRSHALEMLRVKVSEAFLDFIGIRDMLRRLPRTGSVTVNDHLEQAVVGARNRCAYLSAVLAWNGWLFKDILPYTQQVIRG